MALVKFSRKEFEKHVKLNKDIGEKIAMFGTPLESLTEEEICIEIFPNRPDLLSLQGYLRSFLAFLGKKTGLREYKVRKPEKNFEVRVDSSVRNIRPFTVCAIVKSLKFDNEKIKEIIDVQEKIHTTMGRNRKKIAIGIYPLEKISLPIKFEARVPRDIKFVPLGSSEEMNGMQILQRHPAGREYDYLLEGKEKFPVFVDSNNEILSMPPIINSHKTGKITQETKEIFIECSGFDLEVLSKALNILVTILADMGGEIYQMKISGLNIITPDLKPEKMKLNLENVNKLLGLNLKEPEIKKLLEKMGYNYKNKEAEIPAYRVDVLHEVDLIEDIAIAYGYDKLVPEIPTIPGVGEEDKKQVLNRKISEMLTGLGIIEVSNYHLLTKEEIKKADIKAEIEVEESKTDYKILRPNLMIPTLKILSSNIDSEYPQKIFEIGRVFSRDDKSETGIKEKDNLVVVRSPGNFTEIKQVLEYLGRMLDIKFEIKETQDKNFIEGRVGKILFEGKEIGIIGEIHPQTLKNWHLKMPVSLFEICVDELLS